MKLISGLVSNNAAKVRIVLAEKALEVDVLEVPWTKEKAWQPKPALLLDANPRAEVPVLIDGELTLWDSTVINEYIEEKFPAVPLLPKEPEARALCRLWEDEGDHNQAHVGVLIREVFLAESGTPLSDEARTALSGLNAFCDRLERQLGGNDYICGDYSLADVSVFLTLAFATTLGAEITQPQTSQWMARMMARPAVKTEFETIMAAVAAL